MLPAGIWLFHPSTLCLGHCSASAHCASGTALREQTVPQTGIQLILMAGGFPNKSNSEYHRPWVAF